MRLAPLALVFLALPAAAKKPKKPDPRVTASDALFAAYGKTTPGCAAGVVLGGKTVLAKGYGMADLEHGVAITRTSVFDVGSVAKQEKLEQAVLDRMVKLLADNSNVGKNLPTSQLETVRVHVEEIDGTDAVLLESPPTDSTAPDSAGRTERTAR